jgi:hypothetical protein
VQVSAESSRRDALAALTAHSDCDRQQIVHIRRSRERVTAHRASSAPIPDWPCFSSYTFGDIFVLDIDTHQWSKPKTTGAACSTNRAFALIRRAYRGCARLRVPARGHASWEFYLCIWWLRRPERHKRSFGTSKAGCGLVLMVTARCWTPTPCTGRGRR